MERSLNNRTVYDRFVVKVESLEEAKITVAIFKELGFNFKELGFNFIAEVQKFNCYYVAQEVIFSNNSEENKKFVSWGRSEMDGHDMIVSFKEFYSKHSNLIKATPLNKEAVDKYFIITDLSFSDFMKDKEGSIKLYDTYQEAGLVCGMYEFEDAIVCQVLLNHVEDEPRFDFTAQFPRERFEYLKTKNLKDNDLESLGDRGWEMCGVNDNGFFFKRKIITIREATLEVSDIRNKLSPVTHLIAVLEMIDDNDLPQRERESIWKAIDKSKKSINYLSQRNVY
jgi:hypothetical protein